MWGKRKDESSACSWKIPAVFAAVLGRQAKVYTWNWMAGKITREKVPELESAAERPKHGLLLHTSGGILRNTEGVT